MANNTVFTYGNYIYHDVLPSTNEMSGTPLAQFFYRYLLQKAFSVFKWKLPEHWAKEYFLYTLYGFGFVAVVQTSAFGAIPQACGLTGYDVFYRPTHATISNPCLRGIMQPRIGRECELIKLRPDYGGIMDLVTFYGDLMAQIAQTAGMNLTNSKLSYVFTAKNKAGAESFKRLYNDIMHGKTAVVQDKDLLMPDGKPGWQSFEQNVGQNYIADKLLSDLRKVEAMFDTVIGIPNANTDKKERLITDEVNANNVETATHCELWLEELNTGIDKVNTMFNTDISVDWRVKPDEKKGDSRNENHRN